MKNQSLQAPRALRRDRPALIRVVGVLTIMAVAAQAGAHFGIEAWLDAKMFAAATLGPAPVQIGPDVWAAKVGAMGPFPTANFEALTHSALHYQLLAMAISWTTAAAFAVGCMRMDQKARMSDTSLRPARAVPLLSPAAI